LINVGGAKVRPEEIEQQLLAIAGVMDAHVFGRRNPISGQLVAAEVVAMPGVDCADLRNCIPGTDSPGTLNDTSCHNLYGSSLSLQSTRPVRSRVGHHLNSTCRRGCPAHWPA